MRCGLPITVSYRTFLVFSIVAMSGCFHGDRRPVQPWSATGTAHIAGSAAGPQKKGAFAELSDIRVYYESAGSGPPVVFLHGGFGSSETWDGYFPLLGQSHRVIAPDSRGQGRTTIGRGPISYGRMAGDAVRLLDHLGIAKAHFVGFSDGGCTTLHLLTDYPDRVRSATLIGTPYHTDNYPPEVFAGFGKLLADLAGSERARSAYAARAPDPAAWPELVKRLGRTWLTQPAFTEGELGLIEAPVLIVKVDRDEFIPAPVFDRLRVLIPHARVLHLPEGTHRVPTERPAEIAAGIRSFIASLPEH